jgi:glycosyltransferase involved in cell wall biosynthesis
MLSVDTVVQFFPRGGSAQVIRYLGGELTRQGAANRIICGSLGAPGQLSHAQTFYAGLDVRPVDYTPAATAYTGGCTGMDGQPTPFHPSYEDRGPDAPDRMFTAVPPGTIAHLTAAWTRHLAERRSDHPTVVHLHHLSHLQRAVRQAYPATPVVTTLHGTDLKLLARAIQVTRVARRLGVPPATLAAAAGDPRQAETLARTAQQAGLPAGEISEVLETDWPLWPHAGTWAAQMQASIRLAGKIVAVSASDAAAISELLAVPPGDITVIPNGVDATRFAPLRLAPEQRLSLLRRWLTEDPRGWRPGQPPGSIHYTDSDLARLTGADGNLRPVLLWVGRYQRVKRLDVLLEAFARLVSAPGPAPVLLLWGGYPGECEGEHPLATAERLGIASHVYLIGWRGHDELAAGLNCADLMVAPAVNESFGMVYVEAQACGTPPVATRTGGPATLITSHGPRADGWTVQPDSVTDLAGTLAAALASPHERARRAANGAARAPACYSWPAIATQYQDIYGAARERQAPRA